MSKLNEISVVTKVSRHNSQFARLVTIPLEAVAPWELTDTTVVEGEINNVEIGRRSLKRWDDRQCWWIDLPEALCRKAKIDTGDWVSLRIRLASEELPAELVTLLMEDPIAADRWSKLTKAQQRMLREDILSAKLGAVRTKRAQKVLCQK